MSRRLPLGAGGVIGRNSTTRARGSLVAGPKRPDCRQNAVCDPARSLADSSHLSFSAARVHLYDLRSYGDRHTVAGKATNKPIEGRRQSYGANLGDLLILTNRIADACLGAEDAIERRIHVPVAGVPGDLPWLSGERPRCAVSDDDAEPFPTRFHNHISVSSRHEAGAKADGQRSELTLNLRWSMLVHPCVHQDRGPNVSEQRADVSDVHGNRVVRSERFLNLSEVMRTHRVDTLKSGVPVEYGVGESHTTPRGRGRWQIMEYDGVAVSEQAMGYGGADVPNATNDHRDALSLHGEIVQ